jgi:hypothetical protein
LLQHAFWDGGGDSVAALALIPFLIKEARGAIQGEDACCSVGH